MNRIENLRKESEILSPDASEHKRKPSNKIGFILLAIGALALIGSILETSTVLAFIGLGLTFWGVLFLFARSPKIVTNTVVSSTAVSSFATIDRIIEDLNYKGKAIYIPPYPKEAHLPRYLVGLREMTVFIPAEDVVVMPTLEEMARKQFLLENPKGICIAPPGYGLVSLLERELKAEFTQIDLDTLYNALPTIIAQNLELAREFEINSEKDLIHVKMIDSVYSELFSREQDFKSLHLIGCPLTSAIACALTKTTGKLITIVKDMISPDLEQIEIWYQTLGPD